MYLFFGNLVAVLFVFVLNSYFTNLVKYVLLYFKYITEMLLYGLTALHS